MALSLSSYRTAREVWSVFPAQVSPERGELMTQISCPFQVCTELCVSESKAAAFCGARRHSQTPLTYFSKHFCVKAQKKWIKLWTSISNQPTQTPLSPAPGRQVVWALSVHEETLLGSGSVLSQHKVRAEGAVQSNPKSRAHARSLCSPGPASPVLALLGWVLNNLTSRH